MTRKVIHHIEVTREASVTIFDESGDVVEDFSLFMDILDKANLDLNYDEVFSFNGTQYIIRVEDADETEQLINFEVI